MKIINVAGARPNFMKIAPLMEAFEPVLLAHKTPAVLVVGDVNSTIACGLTLNKPGHM